MSNEILSYFEMCQREGSASLQRGMNYQLRDNHSVILMSVRPGAPYADKLEDNGTILIYEGHNVPKSAEFPIPAIIDQPEYTPGGKLTQNGEFHRSAQLTKSGKTTPERVRVYEKLKKGIWSYNGIFHLVDSWRETSQGRVVFKFKLVAVESDEDFNHPPQENPSLRRIIPTSVKLDVWKRDGGVCILCGSNIDLHFDHVIPWSKGGSSRTVENVQLLCGKHNLEKRDRIQ